MTSIIQEDTVSSISPMTVIQQGPRAVEANIRALTDRRQSGAGIVILKITSGLAEPLGSRTNMSTYD